jgi:hypothetical protein
MEEQTTTESSPNNVNDLPSSATSLNDLPSSATSLNHLPTSNQSSYTKNLDKPVPHTTETKMQIDTGSSTQTADCEDDIGEAKSRGKTADCKDDDIENIESRGKTAICEDDISDAIARGETADREDDQPRGDDVEQLPVQEEADKGELFSGENSSTYCMFSYIFYLQGLQNSSNFSN